MATIIDSLLVTLGLDPKPYKKGKDEAEKSNKQLAANTKKTGAEMQASITGVVRQIGLLVLGFESIRGAISFLGGINNADAALGRLAANTGQNVHEINLWGNAVELAGGDAKDAQRDILNLSGSITALRTQGTVSPLIDLMQKLGVSADDAEGKLKPMTQLLDEMGGKLRQFDRRSAFNIGTDAGISEGTLNFLLLEEGARRRILAQAEHNNNLDKAASDRAQALQTQWRDMGQGVREFGRELLEAVTPAATALFTALKPVQDTIIDIVRKLNDMKVPEKIGDFLLAGANALNRALDRWDAFSKSKAEDADLGKRAAAGEPAAQPQSLWEGISSFWDLSKRPNSDESQTAFRARMYRQKQDAATAEQNRTNMLSARSAQRLGASNAARAEHFGTGSGTQVQIDQITIHTQATDADGIAADMRGALERKGVVNQADTGMN